MNPSASAVAARVAALAVVVVCWASFVVAAYVTRNGWFFVSWLPLLVCATLVLRVRDALWIRPGRHEAAR